MLLYMRRNPKIVKPLDIMTGIKHTRPRLSSEGVEQSQRFTYKNVNSKNI